MKKSLLYIITIITLFNSNLFSQTVYPDAGSWNTLNVDFSLNKKISAIFTEELRFKENYSRLNLFYTNIGAEVKMSKNIKVALVYRFIEKYQDDNSFSFRHRLMLDITFKKKFEKIIFSYRQRIQAEVRDVYSSEIGHLPEWYSRNKFSIKYDNDKRLIPFAYLEIRYQFANPRQWQSDNTFHRNRYAIGANYKLNKKSDIGLYYLIQKEYNVVNPQNLYITGLEYNISF